MNESETQQTSGSPKPGRALMPPLRVWLPLLILAAIIVVLQMTELTGQRGIANSVGILFGMVIFGVGIFWFSFRSGHAKGLRYGVFLTVAAATTVFLVCFRLSGFTGDMVPHFSFRFATKPDERLRIPEAAGATADLQTTTEEDFWQFLGPHRNLIVDNVAIDPDWANKPPERLWLKEIGAGWSAFAVVNGYAVTMEQRGSAEMVICYDAKTGELCWSYEHAARYESVLGGVGPRATPTIHEGKVYALGATGLLVCLEGSNGKLLWKRDLLEEFDKPESEEANDLPFGRANSPLIVNNLVVVPVGGPREKRVSLAAFDRATGEMVWQAGNRHIGYSSPALAKLAGREQILHVSEAHVFGHDPETGKVLWVYDWEGHSNTDATSSQAVAVGEDKVFVSRGYGGGVALLQIIPKADGAFEVTVIYRIRGVLRTKFTNVAMKDGHIYGLSEGVLECVQLEDGQRVWKGGRYGHGQILLVGEHLLVLTETGELLLIEATPEKSNQVLGRIEALEGKTWNNLALHGELLLVRNGEQAACFRLALQAR